MRNDRNRTIVHLLKFSPAKTRTIDAFLLKLAELLRSRGWRSVHIFSGEPPEEFRKRLEELDSPYHVTDFPIDWARARRLAGLIRPYRPEIIQTAFMSAFDLPLWWLKRAGHAKNWVFADHSSGACSPRSGLKKLVAKARGAVASRMIDQVVAVSDYVARRDIEQNMLSRRKVRTIYNGVDTERFHPNGHSRGENDTLTVVYAGQLIPEKGLDLAIEAVRRVSEKWRDKTIRLTVAGAGHMREELERYAAAVLPGRAEFVGQVEDVPALFRSADLAVFPSRWEEAFGLVVAEAMACGAPVIASDAGGMSEVIGRQGDAGLVFRNGDISDLERNMLALVAQPELRARLGRRARERAIAEFSIGSMVEHYASLYEELVPHAAPLRTELR